MMNIRTGTIDDLQTIAEIEARSFPPAEAASSKVLKERLLRFPEHFWIMEETNGVISAFVCGMATDEPRLRDEMFENAELHQKAGDWQMIFAVAAVPEYRGRGRASALLNGVIGDVKSQGRKGLVLTCKKSLIPFYETFGFRNEGVSASVHGGAIWYDMRLRFSCP